MASEKTGNPEVRRIFLPNARVLSREEIENLPEREREFVRESRKDGVWVELSCPDELCSAEEKGVKLPVFCEQPKHEHSLWLDIFCPGEQCNVDEPIKAT